MSDKTPIPIKPPVPPEPPLSFYGILNLILQQLRQINGGVLTLGGKVEQNSLDIAALKKLALAEASALASLAASDQANFNTLNEGIQQVIGMLTPPKPGPAVAFEVEVMAETELTKLKQEGDDMASKAKTIKFKINILDNGTAVATISGVVDAQGLPTTFDAGTIPTWVCETSPGAGQDPNIVLTPAPDGMTCLIGPSAPPALVNGDTLTATATGPTMGTLTGAYSPINVVAGPASTFVVTVQ